MTLTGVSLKQTSAVTVGGLPAASFRVVSDTSVSFATMFFAVHSKRCGCLVAESTALQAGLSGSSRFC